MEVKREEESLDDKQEEEEPEEEEEEEEGGVDDVCANEVSSATGSGQDIRSRSEAKSVEWTILSDEELEALHPEKIKELWRTRDR